MAIGCKMKDIFHAILIVIASFAVQASKSSPIENDENFMVKYLKQNKVYVFNKTAF